MRRDVTYRLHTFYTTHIYLSMYYVLFIQCKLDGGEDAREREEERQDKARQGKTRQDKIYFP